MLEKVKLGTEAVIFLRNELEQGQRFSEYVLKLSLEKGEMITFLPKGTGSEFLKDFGESMRYSTGENVTIEVEKLISDFILAYLMIDEKKIVVFETLWEINKYQINNKPCSYFTYHNKKYDFITNIKKGNNTINECISDAQGYPTVFICTTTSSDMPIPIFKEIEDEFIQKMANNTEHIIIGAFDGEGYMIWSPPIGEVG